MKQGYAGLTWDAEAFGAKVALASQQLEALAREPKTVEPGRYRVYLTPAALHEVLELLASGAFSLKAHKTKQTPLLRMVEGESRLGAGVRLSEDTVHGVGPNFQSEGFLKPDEVPLIVDGAYRDCLISPRSAREFGVETNGADGSESPSAIAMAPGELPRAEILQELGTGVYVGNLWYMNFSDRSACRTTGMTRFATFWVEDGEIVAPLKVMRFDETIYRMLGENLRGLTQERDLILDAGTYFRRSTGSAHLPGALVEDFTFTL